MRFFATLTANGKSFRPWMCSGVWPIAAEMSEHVIEHGRMITPLDDEMARNVCVIGTETRNELWGAPEKVGKEIIPVGETVYINGVPFTIVGMFQHYESEQARKAREYEKLQAAKQPQTGGVVRDRGHAHGSGRRGNFVFYLKNATVYVPLNTVWMKFRSGVALTGFGSRFQPSGGAGGPGGATGDPRLSSLELRMESFDRLPEALQQARNVLMTTHKGIEDFAFRTQEEWAEQINTFIENARLSGGLTAGISLLVGAIGLHLPDLHGAGAIGIKEDGPAIGCIFRSFILPDGCC
jgi:putative ABC transport system permease protein